MAAAAAPAPAPVPAFALAPPVARPPEGVQLNVARQWVVTTLAGSAYGFVDGVGLAARFYSPECVAVTPLGILYISDTWNGRIRQIDPATGTVTTLAGSGVQGFADGVGRAAQFNHPRGIAVAPSGILYVADSWNHRIRQIDPATGTVTTLAGSGGVGGFADGVGVLAEFSGPSGVAVAPSGVLYVSDSGNRRIRQIDLTTSAVTTFAGSGADGFLDGVRAAAQFGRINCLTVAPSGVLYVADTGNHRIRQIDPITGDVTTLAGSAEGFADGVGALAQFTSPFGLALTPSGVLYVADMWNHRIRQIDLATRVVTTLAGSGVLGFAEGIGVAARFNQPFGIAVTPSGVLYVVDTGNQRIRQITPRTNPGLKNTARRAAAFGEPPFPPEVTARIFGFLGGVEKQPGVAGIYPKQSAEYNPGEPPARRNTRRKERRKEREERKERKERRSTRKRSRRTSRK